MKICTTVVYLYGTHVLGPNISIKFIIGKREKLNTKFKIKKYTDINTCTVLNASKVPLIDVETSLLSGDFNFPAWGRWKKAWEDTRPFFKRLRLREHFSRKNPSKDHTDDPLRPCTTKWNISGTLESYIESAVTDLERLLTKQKVVPDNLTKNERSALQKLKNGDDINIK